ncbi:terminase small subunit [Allorhizobium ampelinum]|uniref:terminase small subunit n=1 Tax=Allorhizobium ampelinum TaxID=3025782 RepID=UPI000B3FD572|nr:terminase small subunit [Allorhizobium ampelinum]NTA27412.1 hypothetical protein [Allorhizobium ampelinum]OVE94468.1 hypothetical protein B7W85_13025 [Allorhizobium ampelinum]
MPVLKNARREAFAQGVAKGMSATEAYAVAGYKGDRKAASNLWTNVDVRERVAELSEKAAKRAIVSASDVLIGLHDEALRTGEGSSHSARVAAWTALGKYHKLFVDKIEADVSVDLTVTDAKSKLEHIINRLASPGSAQSGDSATE